jgi:hypothetical protein
VELSTALPGRRDQLDFHHAVKNNRTAVTNTSADDPAFVFPEVEESAVSQGNFRAFGVPAHIFNGDSYSQMNDHLALQLTGGETLRLALEAHDGPAVLTILQSFLGQPRF